MSNDRGLQDVHVRIGTKQTTRSVEMGQATEVYVALDADQRLISKIVALCEEHSVNITYVETMIELGKACSIEVGAAMAAVIKQ
jgi:large subunit ribosomal protein L7A